jgi:8-oxo-dGTP diphosphatase
VKQKYRFRYEYARPALTVDLILFANERKPRVLLVRRKNAPCAGQWALPGGFVHEGEPLEAAARRELQEEAGIDVRQLDQLGAFGDPGRDPRGWTVTVAYVGRVDRNAVAVAGDDAAEVEWFPIDALPEMAFDHRDILAVARKWLRRTVKSNEREK